MTSYSSLWSWAINRAFAPLGVVVLGEPIGGGLVVDRVEGGHDRVGADEHFAGHFEPVSPEFQSEGCFLDVAMVTLAGVSGDLGPGEAARWDSEDDPSSRWCPRPCRRRNLGRARRHPRRDRSGGAQASSDGPP